MEDTDTRYQNERSRYERIVDHTSNNFRIEDTGSSYMLNHRKLPLSIELPTALERGAISHVNMMAPLIKDGSPESMIDTLQGLVRRRDFLRLQGYQQFERFKWYDDGAEIVYSLPTESENDLVRIVCDLDFSRIE